MSNQWGHPQRAAKRQLTVKLLSIFVLIGIVAYLFFPEFKNKINPFLRPTYAAPTSDNYSLPTTNNSLAQNSPTYSIQDSPITDNLSSDNKNNEVTTGYWLLFVANAQMSQLSVEAETITFIQQLIEIDRKSTGANTLMLVENGRFRQYMVSDEIYSVVTNLLVITSRVSKESGNSSLNGSGNSNLKASVNPKNRTAQRYALLIKT